MSIELVCVALFFMGTITGAILVRYGINLGAKIVYDTQEGTLFNHTTPIEQDETV